MKSKIIIILSIVITLMGGSIKVLNDKRLKEKADKERNEKNMYSLTQEIKIERGKNNELTASVNAIEINSKQLKLLNDSLDKKLKQSGIKIKNLQSLLDVKASVIIEKEYVDRPLKLNDSTFHAKIIDDWFEQTQTIHLTNKREDLEISNYKMKMRLPITTAVDVEYKRFWIFWKRPKGFKQILHTDNPYVEIEQMDSYVFDYKNNK